MGRGLFSGLLWGSLVAVMSLWVISQVGGVVGLLDEPAGISATAPDAVNTETTAKTDVAPATGDVIETPVEDTSRVADDLPVAEVESDPVEIVDVTPSGTPESTAQVSELDQPTSDTAPNAPEQTGATDLPNADAGKPATPGIDQLPSVMPSAPEHQSTQATVSVEQPTVQTTEAVEEPVIASVETTQPPIPETSVGPGQPEIPSAETVPGGDFSTPVVVPTPETEPETVTDANGADTASTDDRATADAIPNETVLDGDGKLESAGTLTTDNSSVRTNRLPSIGSENPDIAVIPAPATDGTEPDEALVENLPAIKRFAQEFDNPDNRPLMAIVLLPNDRQGADPAKLLPFPVSYVVDASLDTAPKKMAVYRSGGYEVAALMPLPAGASPQDVETSFQTYFSRVGEAVAVIDSESAEFQSGRAVATQVAQVLAASGHGMITYSKGLNSAPQVAEREGVPAALVFRKFDSDGQDTRAIKRFLDQAAFRAGQQSGVILVGHNRPDTVAALLEWSLGNRASTVALAPISAVLLNQ